MRNYARDLSAYTLGYIHRGHRGGFTAVKAARGVDNSFQNFMKRKGVSKKSPASKRKAFSKSKLKRTAGKTRRTLFKSKRSYPKLRSASSRQLEISQHNDLSSKSFTVGRHHSRGKGVGRYLFSESWDIINADENEGQQSISSGKYLMTTQQLFGQSLTTTRVNLDKWAISPYQMNPYVSTNTTGYFPYQVDAANVANDSFHIQSLNAKFSMVGLSSIPMKVKIYWLMYKRHSIQTPYQVWNDAINYESMAGTTYAPTGQTTTTTAAAGKPTPFVVGQDPFRHKMFRQNFKAIHTETFVLQPGDQRHFDGHFNVNKTITEQYMRQLNSAGTTFIGGITIVPFVIAHGGLVHIKDTDTSEVTYGRISYGLVSNNIYTFKAVRADRVSTIRHFSGMVEAASTSHAGLGLTTPIKEFVVNDTDDAAQNLIIA